MNKRFLTQLLCATTLYGFSTHTTVMAMESSSSTAAEESTKFDVSARREVAIAKIKSEISPIAEIANSLSSYSVNLEIVKTLSATSDLTKEQEESLFSASNDIASATQFAKMDLTENPDSATELASFLINTILGNPTNSKLIERSLSTFETDAQFSTFENNFTTLLSNSVNDIQGTEDLDSLALNFQTKLKSICEYTLNLGTDVTVDKKTVNVGIHAKTNINPAHVGYEFGDLNQLHAYLSESRQHVRAIAKMDPDSLAFKEYLVNNGLVHLHADSHPVNHIEENTAAAKAAAAAEEARVAEEKANADAFAAEQEKTEAEQGSAAGQSSSSAAASISTKGRENAVFGEDSE